MSICKFGNENLSAEQLICFASYIDAVGRISGPETLQIFSCNTKKLSFGNVIFLYFFR